MPNEVRLTPNEKSSWKRWKMGYTVSIMLFLAMIMNYVSRNNISILVADPVFLEQMGLVGKEAVQGFIMGVYVWAYGFSALVLTPIVIKLGLRRAYVIIILSFSISMFIGAAAQNYQMIIVSRVMLALAAGMEFPINTAVIRRWAPPKERGMANAIWTNGVQVGSAIGLPLAAFLVGSSGWRSAFYVPAIAALVIIPLIMVFLYDSPAKSPKISSEELDYIKKGMAEEDAVEEERAKLGEGVYKQLFKNANFWILGIGYVINTWVFWGLTAWFPSFLSIDRGFSFAAMGNLSMLPYLLGVIFAFSMGAICYKLQVKSKIMFASHVAIFISLIGALLVQNNVVSFLFIAIGITGLTTWMVGHLTTTQKMLSKKTIGPAKGILMGVANLTGGFIPAVFGWLITRTGNYSAGLIMLAICSALCLIVFSILMYREKNKRGIWGTK